MGEVLILLGRKLGQLTSRSTRVAFKRAVGGGERIQVILGKGLCFASAAEGLHRRGESQLGEEKWENQGLGTGKKRGKTEKIV